MTKADGGRFLRNLLRLIPLATVSATLSARSLTLTSEPVFTATPDAPLAGVVAFSTDVPSRVRFAVSNEMESWQREFFDYDTSHTVPVLGLKAARTNVLTFTALDRFRNEVTATQSIVVVTAP